MPSKRLWVCFVIVGYVLGAVWTLEARAQTRIDLLQAEGTPTDVAQKLEKSLRTLLGKQGSVKLLANPLSPMMARMTLGCASDSPDCMQRLAQMRNAQYIFTLRILPAGGPMVLAMLSKINGKNGKTVKAASHTFMKNQIDDAATALVQKIGLSKSADVAPRSVPAPVPVARRPAPERRPAPVARRPEPPRPTPVAQRPEPPRPTPVERRPAVVAQPTPRPAPVERRAAPERQPAPVAQRPEPPRPAPVERRTAPERRAPVRVAALPPRQAPEARREAPQVRRSQPPERRSVKVATGPDITGQVTPTTPTPLVRKPIFWAWVSVGVAAAATGVAISFGALSQARQNEINQKLKDSQTGQALSYKEDIQPLESQGQSNAVVANVAIGFAVTGALAAATLFIVSSLQPKKPSGPAAPVPPNSKSDAQTFTVPGSTF